MKLLRRKDIRDMIEWSGDLLMLVSWVGLIALWAIVGWYITPFVFVVMFMILRGAWIS